ncbi:hypothetical protein J31TS4_36670 [Paenibacillus sp. J31TS4]|uniref:hypothetical protein n=1 Tax=Paenibacillus sp. J31TS4 TaxID=2807195 RepID=UPI001B2452E8|nr:hypothetical protein [Paenibacillus sp. J31TS4]GIP40387.1 hypothetical protein J31TS4_36670 [Paenibacillus sp. J31TS4]
MPNGQDPKDLLEKKREAQKQNEGFRSYVEQVSGGAAASSSGKATDEGRLVDDHNRMIDQENLRK